MTENKRYKLHDNYNFGYGIEDISNPKRMYIDDFECIVNELNDLADENEQLKEENRDLNEELMEYDSFILLYKEQRDKLKEENEGLKETIDCICKDYEVSHGMDIRNAEWFTAW